MGGVGVTPRGEGNSGCSASKGHSGSFCAALIKGIEPEKKKMTGGINFDNQLYK